MELPKLRRILQTVGIVFISLLLSMTLICSSTKQGVIEKVGNDKKVFFSYKKKEGFEFLDMYQFKLRKLDSAMEGKEKVFIFYYK